MKRFRSYTLLTSLAAAVYLAVAGFAPDDAPRRGWAEDRLAELTLEQKVSQLFAARAYSYYTSADDPGYRHLVDLVERFEIGGLVFFQGEPFEQATLANELQERAPLPLLMSQDMEWGAGMRVEHTTTFPRTMATGAARDPELAYATGYVTAREARAIGTHQVFAPVADVNNNPYNPIINVRSYSEDPTLVTELVTAFIRGLQDGGVIATAKHFPGHGDTATDSHADLPILPFDRTRLDSLELVPFRGAIREGVGSIMVGHLALPQLEPDSTIPATLSPIVTQDLLRRDLGFEGLIVTDALEMRGVTKHFGVGEAAVRALEAGADMLLLSTDEYAARAAILKAVREGRISEAQVDASVLRILKAKEDLDLHRDRLVDLGAVRDVVATRSHLMASEAVARQGLTLLRNEGELLPFTTQPRILNVVVTDDDDPDAGAFFTGRLAAHAGGSPVTTRVVDLRAREEEMERILDAVDEHDLVVVPAYVSVRAWSGRINLSDRQREFLNELIERGRPVVLISFGNPYIAMGLEQPAAYLLAYGSTEASQEAAAQALFGATAVGGRLPITIPDLYAFGSGMDTPQIVPRVGYPQEVGLAGIMEHRIDSLMRAGIEQGAYPGAAVAVGRAGVVAHLKGYGYYTYDSELPITPQSRFDLASLTKVVATTTAAMKLFEEGRLDLDAPVVRYLPAFGQGGKERVTIRHLLSHTAGLIPYRAYHRGQPAPSREAVIDSIMAEKLQYRPGTDSRYSDLGIITLALVIEEITGQDFAAYTRAAIFEPLGMTNTGFLPAGRVDPSVVPTEVDTFFRKRLIQGEVHDETSWILGGTAGHAGLFSTAEDLSKFAYMLTHEGRYNGRAFLQPETIRLFTTPIAPGRHTRALGWDTRDDGPHSSSGRHFGPRSFGHTGFTGTSIWFDPDQQLYVILLANRVYPTRENRKLFPMRSALADIVHGAIRGEPRPLLPGPAR